MNEQSFPVTVLVKRPDGSMESVRVGTAVRSGDGFRLSLGELSIGAAPDMAPSAPRRSAPPSGSGDGMVFPPYGRSKGAPVVGATINDLEFYRSGCLRTLADSAKARWHDKERVLLAAIDAELARQQGGGAAPSPRNQDAFDDAPPYSDDDIPF